eukprot:10179760-Heterocapsa_arctica.AAC.1
MKAETEKLLMETKMLQQRTNELEDKAQKELEILAAATSTDNYELNETNGSWKTDMTREQATIIRVWMLSAEMKESTNAIILEDDMLLRTVEKETTELEKTMMGRMHIQCHDDLANGPQGISQEQKTPGYKFKIIKNSRFGWVPFGEIYNWCKESWKTMLTQEIFWSIILNHKNEKGVHSYM